MSVNTDAGLVWTRPEDAMPDRGRAIEWIPPSGGNPIAGKYVGVWMMPDGMYVYYRPQFWRYAP